MNKRLLLIGATTGYQTRAFADAAERLGYELVLATDRCHVLDDPWGDRAIALRFEDPRGRGRNLGRRKPAWMASWRWAIVRLISRHSRPSCMGIPYNSPDSVAASRNKFLARERFRAAGLLVPDFHRVPLAEGPEPRGRAGSLSLRAQAARAFRQPRRDSRR